MRNRRRFARFALLALTLLLPGCGGRAIPLDYRGSPADLTIAAPEWPRLIPGSTGVEVNGLRPLGTWNDAQTSITAYAALVRYTSGSQESWAIGKLSRTYDGTRTPGTRLNWESLVTFRADPGRKVQAYVTHEYGHDGRYALLAGLVNDPAVKRVRVVTSGGTTEGALEAEFFWAVWQVGDVRDPYPPPALLLKKVIGYDAGGQVVFEETP